MAEIFAWALVGLVLALIGWSAVNSWRDRPPWMDTYPPNP